MMLVDSSDVLTGLSSLVLQMYLQGKMMSMHTVSIAVSDAAVHTLSRMLADLELLSGGLLSGSDREAVRLLLQEVLAVLSDDLIVKSREPKLSRMAVSGISALSGDILSRTVLGSKLDAPLNVIKTSMSTPAAISRGAPLSTPNSGLGDSALFTSTMMS